MFKKKLLSGALAAVISFTFALTPVEALTVKNNLQGDPEEAWVEGLYGESETPGSADSAEIPISDEREPKYRIHRRRNRQSPGQKSRDRKILWNRIRSMRCLCSRLPFP